MIPKLKASAIRPIATMPAESVGLQRGALNSAFLLTISFETGALAVALLAE